MPRPPSEQPGNPTDPVYLHARREAVVIMIVWGVCLLWTVGTYALLGNRPAEEVRTIWGFPDWVFWSVVVPWLVVDLFTVWFCFVYIHDDDLGEVHEGADLAEQLAAEKKSHHEAPNSPDADDHTPGGRA